jgi:hypothetical protein
MKNITIAGLIFVMGAVFHFQGGKDEWSSNSSRSFYARACGSNFSSYDIHAKTQQGTPQTLNLLHNPLKDILEDYYAHDYISQHRASSIEASTTWVFTVKQRSCFRGHSNISKFITIDRECTLQMVIYHLWSLKKKWCYKLK